MICNDCGEQNPDRARFCIHCGIDLPSLEGRTVEKPGVYRQKTTPSLVDWIRNMETSEDLTHGQVVIITARWILVIAGLMLSLWLTGGGDGDPDQVGVLRVQLVLILALAVANFYLHAQVLMRRPILTPIAYAASAGDIAVVSLIVLAKGGYDSGLYVFYFPAVLALSVSFRTHMTLAFAGAAGALYCLIAVSTGGGYEMQFVITRLLMLAAVAVCGNTYWRLERDRRLVATSSKGPVKEQARRESRRELFSVR